MRRLVMAVLLAIMSVLPAAGADPVETRNPAEAVVNGAIVVKGEGAAPTGPFTLAQKRIMALRAAKSVAMREAAEILDGVTVTGETTVLNASAESDRISAAAEGVIKGATVVREDFDAATGMASIVISVPMQGAAGALMPAVAPFVTEMPQFRPGLSAKTAGYDGVIIDARGKALRPALVNRILTKDGQIIYDPSKASPEVLAAGATGYTNDMARAKDLLSKKGSVNPLVVKASGVKRSTDVELGPIESAAVFLSNQMTNYLKAGRVIFVLD